MAKYVVIDFSEIFFTCVFSNWRMKHTPGMRFVMGIEWLVLRKLFSYTKAYPDHKIMLMADGTQSWRKEVYPEYKANRKVQRDKYEDIDWADIFTKYSQMLSALDMYTPMNVYRDDLLEADDLEAVLAKDGAEIVLFSSDKDLNQLAIYPNVTLISPKVKKVKNKFVTRVISDPYKELNKLVKSGDKADNVPPAKTEAQALINNKIVNLITLPPEIEARARSVLQQKHVKSINPEMFYELYPLSFIPGELTMLCEAQAQIVEDK